MTRQRAMKVNHKKKTITITRQLNPPSFHAWMMNKVTTENPDYKIIEDFNDA